MESDELETFRNHLRLTRDPEPDTLTAPAGVLWTWLNDADEQEKEALLAVYREEVGDPERVE